MEYEIKQWINVITKSSDYTECSYTFYGDGFGDAEKHVYEAPLHLLIEHKRFCQEQIQFVDEYIAKRYPNEKQ